jgi:hypothetical protein
VIPITPDAMAISGSDLFVVDRNFGTVGEYNTSGATDVPWPNRAAE